MNDVSEAAPTQGMLARARDRALLAFGVAVALLIALTFVEGTYALWTASATAEGTTVTTGTVELAAEWAPEQDGLWGALLPGESAQQGFTLTNTGDADLEISVATNAVAAFEVRALSASCGQMSSDAGLVGDAARPLATADDATTAIVLAPGRSAQGCVEVRVTGAAQPGQALDFVLRFDGAQVTR